MIRILLDRSYLENDFVAKYMEWDFVDTSVQGTKQGFFESHP